MSHFLRKPTQLLCEQTLCSVYSVTSPRVAFEARTTDENLHVSGPLLRSSGNCGDWCKPHGNKMKSHIRSSVCPSVRPSDDHLSSITGLLTNRLLALSRLSLVHIGKNGEGCQEAAMGCRYSSPCIMQTQAISSLHVSHEAPRLETRGYLQSHALVALTLKNEGRYIMCGLQN
jgi:hypothetical protein